MDQVGWKKLGKEIKKKLCKSKYDIEQAYDR